MNTPIFSIKVLLVEDDAIDQLAFKRCVKQGALPYDYTIAGSLAEAKTIIESNFFDIAILDFHLGDGSALELVDQVKLQKIPFVVATGNGDEEIAVHLMQQGAYDYLIKDPNLNYLKVLSATVDKAIRRKRAEEKIRLLNHAIQNVCDGIYIVDQTNQILFINDALSQICGIALENAIGQPLETLNQPGLMQCIENQASEGNICGLDLEVQIVQPDGSSISMLLSESYLQEGEKQLRVGILRNINRLKQIEQDLRASREELEQRVEERTSELKASEQRYMMLAAAAPVGIFRTDNLGKCVYVNQRWYQMTGLTSLEALGQKWFQILYPEDQDLVTAEWVRAVQTARPFRLEYRLQRPDQSTIWVDGQCVAERDHLGQVIGYVGTIADISDRKRVEAERMQAERDLQQLNQQLEAIVEERTQELGQVNSLQRAILDGADYSIISTDPNGIIQTLNAAAEKMLGYSATEIIGKITLDFVHEPREILERIPSLCAELGTDILPGYEVLVAKARQGLASEEEWTYIRKDGSHFPVLLSVSTLKDANYQIMGFLAIAKDITQRKRAEAQLQEQEQFLRSLYDGVDYPIFVIDVVNPETFLYIDWNVAAENASKIPVQEIIGKSPEEVYGLQAGRIERERLQQCLAIEMSLSYEERLEFPGQCESWWLTTLNPLKDVSGQIYRIVGTTFNISALKQVETQLQHTNEELARVTRLKDEFLANMSHELRTPLNAILGMAEGLQDAIFGMINEKQLKALQTIERSGSHLLELINDILDLAKIESGQIELDLTPTTVALLCQSSLALIKQQALKKQIQLEVKLPPELPDLLVDERRIRQVLINLLNNAVKFTPEGGRITLEVSSPFPFNNLLEKTYLQIAVIDTGIGIAADQINRLFQPFIQIDSALNRQYNGTGLGLALVKRIVELHGGQVGLTSEVGVGSCFTIILPSIDSTPTFSEQITLQETPINLCPTGQKISPLILLAEDNEANIVTISSYLNAKDYRILLAKNGQEALSLVHAENPDLILMDIQMPGMDGLQAIQKIRLDPSLGNVPIIALTALAMTGDRDRCLAAGANDYLSKPIKLKQLAITIQQLLTSQAAFTG
jgi:PAS domain S-box-containing protein